MKDLLVSSLSVVAKTFECTIDLEDELNVTGCGIVHTASNIADARSPL